MRKRAFAVLGVVALLLSSVGPRAARGDDHAADRALIAAALDDFHAAAAAADGPRYFAHLSEDAVFLGTDATERWTKAEFEVFARPYFEAGRGWTYAPTARRIVMGGDAMNATFDELLSNESYGTCRSSGAMRKEGGTWRIVQFNLSIPIPNELARGIVARIRGETKMKTIYLVRHAEKLAGAADPSLRPEGRERAAQLARLLRSAAVRAVYATDYARARETAAPTAADHGLTVTSYDPDATRALADALRADAGDGAVLVVGHSDTTPALLGHLGVRAPVTIPEDEYDNLFVVTLAPTGSVSVQHLHYGR